MCNALPQLQPNPHNALPYSHGTHITGYLREDDGARSLGGATHIRIFFYLCMRRGVAKIEELRNR